MKSTVPIRSYYYPKTQLFELQGKTTMVIGSFLPICIFSVRPVQQKANVAITMWLLTLQMDILLNIVYTKSVFSVIYPSLMLYTYRLKLYTLKCSLVFWYSLHIIPSSGKYLACITLWMIIHIAWRTTL